MSDPEIVNFDQAQRDAIAMAIEEQKRRLKLANAKDKIDLIRKINGDDIAEGFEAFNQCEINKLESVTRFFTAHRPYAL